MASNCRIGKGEGQSCESRGATTNTTRFRSRSGRESAAGVERGNSESRRNRVGTLKRANG